MGRITRITKNVSCTWPKRGCDEYYGEVSCDDISDGKCNRINGTTLATKLQRKNKMSKFLKISQNPFRKPIVNARMIVMKVMGVYNKIIIHHSYNGIP